ncbi:MAG: 16S rRNA (cytidine(1402)-2'-O)-methyltransferase [Ruminococcaceae bacterium]|nr:16S rRNA (cytidine(1402)-2'-O)-methyltransferase [Oscillospiraceae bacterium]
MISDTMNPVGTLYVVATPIGCLDDLTPRAAETLKAADIIAAEDTRTSWPLLSKLGIDSKLISYHKFNERSRVEELLDKLNNGCQIALISDAGTPCISDPGCILVEAAAAAGIKVVAVCGACAAVSAASVSGFDLTSFAFYGFVPRETGEIKKLWSRMLNDSIKTAIFYESPMRITATIASLAETAPAARLCVCNDLTKLHERIYRGSPTEVLAELEANPNHKKGEYTIVMETPTVPAEEEEKPLPETLLFDYLMKNDCSIKEAVAAVAAKGVYSKKELFAAGVRLKALLNDEL